MIIKFLNKYSIGIYVLILVLSLLFLFLLMGASGHGFHFNFNLLESISIILTLCGIFIVPLFKTSIIENPIFSKLIHILSFFILLGTLFVGIYLLYENIIFDYGDILVLLIFTFIILFFLVINVILIKQVFNSLKTKS